MRRIRFSRPRRADLVADRSGATAVEFAMVAPAFLALLMAIAENGLVFLHQTTLDFATAETARDIRTGQVQIQGASAEDLHDEICTRMQSILAATCASDLYLDVRSFENFGEVNAPDPEEDGTVDEDDTAFSPGAPGEVVLVRTFYRYGMITPMFTGVDYLGSTALFRNEPYSSDDD